MKLSISPDNRQKVKSHQRGLTAPSDQKLEQVLQRNREALKNKKESPND